VGIHANEIDTWKLLNQVRNRRFDCRTGTARRRPKMISDNWGRSRHTLYWEETRKQLLRLFNVDRGQLGSINGLLRHSAFGQGYITSFTHLSEGLQQVLVEYLLVKDREI